MTTIPLIFHHLKRNLSQTFVGNVLFHTYDQLKAVDIRRHESNRLQHKENQIWILQCTNEKLSEENKQLKKQNSKERIQNFMFFFIKIVILISTLLIHSLY